MFSVWKWRLIAFARKLWVRAALFTVLGVITALVAALAQRLLPPGFGHGFGANSVDAILTILANSMLAVTTFSLGIMVQALASAAQTATPRAVQLLLQDTTTQNVLATFLGSFLFSLVGIIALKAGVYGSGGRLVLYLVTLVIVALIVVTMLRWIAHLSDFGRMQDVLSRVERAAESAFRGRMEAPFLGGHPARGPVPEGARPVFPDRVGYVQHLDAGALQSAAEAAGVQVRVVALPGSFVSTGEPLCYVFGGLPAAEAKLGRFAAAYTLGSVRQFDQDPRWGLQVLAEIASRALSPAVNDPGTAIDVLGRAVRLLAPWGEKREIDLLHPRLWVPEIAVRDLFEDLFRPIGRDGASLIEVQIRLQKMLLALAQTDPADFGREALRQSDAALERAEVALTLEADRAIVRGLNEEMQGRFGSRPPAREVPGI